MIGYVEELLQSLGLAYRLLQCCTGDLGVKNADMIDIERAGCRAAARCLGDGSTTGAYGETHSASRPYDYQCRRLNMRYRAGGEGGKGDDVLSLVEQHGAGEPRVLIPILEMWQNQDRSVTVPPVLRPYMGGKERIG